MASDLRSKTIAKASISSGLAEPKKGAHYVRNYEIAIVLHPDLEIDIESATQKVEKIIEGAKGKVTKKDNWGKRKLAYKIKKQDWGIYVFYQVQLDPSAVNTIESTLRITEEVMRYLIVSLENTRLVSKTNQQNSDSDAKEDDRSEVKDDKPVVKRESTVTSKEVE